jgi:hypothetical protein
MSADRPPTPQRRELEIMNVLFERRLKDRAIALADSRFPGAGKMVDLAYEWGELDPAERRDRLSAIGPEDIAKFRDFAELNPDLSKAVDELDRRGVLPQLENVATDIAEASQQAQAKQAASAAKRDEPEPEEQSSEPAGRDEPPTSASERTATPDVEDDFDELDIAPLHVDMPDLDLGLPSTSEFLEGESGRREEASRSAEEAMERVRKSLDQATQRAFDRSSAVGVTKMPEIARPTLPSLSLQQEEENAATEQVASRAISAPTELARHLEHHAIAVIRADEPRPTPDQLVALANDRQIGYSEHTVSLENRKEAFGGLVSEFGRITVRPGTIPKAVAAANLVVIHGRLAPQIADRIEEGFFDIPGTRASVKVHPDARIVVLGG